MEVQLSGILSQAAGGARSRGVYGRDHWRAAAIACSAAIPRCKCISMMGSRLRLMARSTEIAGTNPFQVTQTSFCYREFKGARGGLCG